MATPEPNTTIVGTPTITVTQTPPPAPVVPATPATPPSPVVTAPAATPAPTAPFPNANSFVAYGDVQRGRTDDDVLTGHFADIVSGEHEGRWGVFQTTATLGSDGYPKTVVIKTRDDRDELLTVNYSDIRPSTRRR